MGASMATAGATAATIDEYIAGFPADVRAVLGQVRETIRAAAPDAEETIKYQLPTFTLEGNLVHFGAFTAHIGFYPTPSGIDRFQDELSVYRGGRGSVRFPLDEPMPFDLIRRIVEFRVRENVARVETRRRKERGGADARL